MLEALKEGSMRAFRYFLAGFEILVALVFFSSSALSLITTVQLSLLKAPLETAKRAAFVSNLGQAMVVTVMGAVFAFWMARCALRNFRDAKAKASTVESPSAVPR
jgi:hypothetical protein